MIWVAEKKMRFLLFAKRHCYKKAEKGIMA
jgi:hypothetical protein